ncbi:MAG: hypothetical protein DRJ63_08280 [Thermoprotei archaeon]|nr:MAG: hypothetical protein DRJ63_08280 [Thermoprotei archaeon]
MVDEAGPKSILILATTSEGESLSRVWRHTYAHVSLLRNLDRDGFAELAKQLNPLSARKIEEVWCLTGGSPRALMEVALKYKWNAESG